MVNDMKVGGTNRDGLVIACLPSHTCLINVSCSNLICSMENGLVVQEREIKGLFETHLTSKERLIQPTKDVIRRAKGNPDKTGSFVRLIVLIITKELNVTPV
jgi:hypothetical protein